MTLSPFDSYTEGKPTLQGHWFSNCLNPCGFLEEKYDHDGHVSFVSTPLPSCPTGLGVLGH